MKIWKFKVIDRETNEELKFHTTTEIKEDLGIAKATVYNIIQNPDKWRRKWRKYNIETIREPYILEY